MLNELFLSRTGGQVWSLLREAGRTVELRAEREDQPVRVGRIVQARVTNVLPAIQSVFLDVGLDRDAFLHVSDLVLPGEEQAAGGTDESGRPTPGAVEDRLKPGSELLVQVVREAGESKGVRASCLVGLPGRLLVLFPWRPQSGISRRIADDAERERLTDCVMRLGGGQYGFVARTAAAGAPFEALERDAGRLLESWQRVREMLPTARAPAVLHNELPLPLRLLRDGPREGWERIVVDDQLLHDQIAGYLRGIELAAPAPLELHDEPRSIFDAYGLSRDVGRALRPRVWLQSGGYLVVEQTEALVSIDVNTGKSTRGNEQERTILETNLEAAAEIGRQLRLRDLGGIVVVDFIDMASPEPWGEVLRALEASLQNDPARTKIVGLSELGLLQMTRKRTRAGFGAVVTETCPGCSGSGRIHRAGIPGLPD